MFSFTEKTPFELLEQIWMDGYEEGRTETAEILLRMEQKKKGIVSKLLQEALEENGMLEPTEEDKETI